MLKPRRSAMYRAVKLFKDTNGVRDREKSNPYSYLVLKSHQSRAKSNTPKPEQNVSCRKLSKCQCFALLNEIWSSARTNFTPYICSRALQKKSASENCISTGLPVRAERSQTISFCGRANVHRRRIFQQIER